ncbi:MAG: peptidyl-prolyl cis-trans isomerase [Ilumatobacteraceae bacterium]|nr:peptidyl-prolyl cis-trans isomerase [Ilumatobacteraceae bacterium]MCU1391513.1 peptidyl-prolyl cis-trans isomerase [Ilumatobacteraceae bacterium]
MGTDKRERQKANRQLKLEEMAREARKRKTKKRGLQFGLGVPLLIVVVFGAIRLFGKDDTKSISAASTTAVATDGSADISTTSGVPGQPLACPAEDGSAAAVHQFPAAPTMCIDTTKKYTVTVTTSLGAYTAELDATKAPLAVNSFVYLARYHYFDNTPCHRIIPGFVIQCGDPTGTGSGNPGYSFKDELPKAGEYKLGSLAMANSGADTNGSQFFVISGNDGIALPPKYSLFGQVTSGLDVVAKLDAVGTAGAGTPSTPVTINSVTVAES